MTFVSSINFINDKLQPPFAGSCGQITFLSYWTANILAPIVIKRKRGLATQDYSTWRYNYVLKFKHLTK